MSQQTLGEGIIVVQEQGAERLRPDVQLGEKVVDDEDVVPEKTRHL